MTQCNQVLDHLKNHEYLTPFQAFVSYRITRLAARIFELKQKGHKIKAEVLKDNSGTRYARYSLS